MSAPVKLAAFAALLAVLFGGAALAGGAIDPDRAERRRSRREPRTAPRGGPPRGRPRRRRPRQGGAAPARCAASRSPRAGCASSSTIPSCAAAAPSGSRSGSSTTRGATVRDFDVEHTKRMHLIVARRDLTGFQHLHPEQAADGTWTTRVRLDEAGSYRLFADFSHDGEARTLATDLRVDGAADLRPLPAARADRRQRRRLRRRARRRRAHPARRPTCASRSPRTARPVHTEPYLGAGGHLVALREGDLAFLHVHPTEARGERRRRSRSIGSTFPTAGRYRLFLQFQHEGRVHTVAFTQEVR